MVDIEHRCLSSLEQDLAALLDLIMQQCDRIADIRAQTVRIAEILFEDSIIVQRLMIIEQLELLILYRQHFFEAAGELIRVYEIADADTDAVGLIHIAGADAALRRTDLVLAALFIADAVHEAVIREHDVGAVADADAREVDAARREGVHLLEHDFRIERDAVTDDAVRARKEDARRHEPQLVGFIIDDDGMAGVAAALIAHDRLCLLGEVVDDLALSLVAPLRTGYYYC